MTGIRREGDAPAAGREDVLLLEKVRRRTLEGKLPARDDILTMLAWKADSPQAVLLGKTARHMARLLAGNRGKVWAAIGVDCVPCPMDCAFCAFGQSRGIVRRARRWRGEEVVRAAAAFAAAGASWVVLRTTEAYGLEALCGLAARVRNVLPSSCCLVANTRQLDGTRPLIPGHDGRACTGSMRRDWARPILWNRWAVSIPTKRSRTYCWPVWSPGRRSVASWPGSRCPEVRWHPSRR